MNDESYKSLVDRLERLKQERAEAAGARDELLRQLKDEFGVGSVKEARVLLATLKQKEESLKRKIDAEYKAFVKKWGDKIKD